MYLDQADRIVVVLHETQNYVNIAGTVRALKNFGLRRLRLVRPVEWDPWKITGIAHDTEDIVDAVEVYDDLDAALADTILVAGFSARDRRAKRQSATPAELAQTILSSGDATETAPVALLFGREDKGLSNAALDRCHLRAGIPTNPDHSSLNLAQAVLVAAYEIWMEAAGRDHTFKPARRETPPAQRHLLEEMFTAAEEALWAVDFFKSRKPTSVLTTLRELAHRAELDTREAAFLRAISIEVRKYVERELGKPPRRGDEMSDSS